MLHPADYSAPFEKSSGRPSEIPFLAGPWARHQAGRIISSKPLIFWSTRYICWESFFDSPDQPALWPVLRGIKATVAAFWGWEEAPQTSAELIGPLEAWHRVSAL